jgi:hypothetical protein
MSDEIIKNSAIRSYLLGDLPDSGAEEIESWYFTDGRRVDEVWAAFSELAEEYLGGGLTENESMLFEQRLSSAPVLRKIFEIDKSLHNYAMRTVPRTAERVETENSVSAVGRSRPARAGYSRVSWLAVAAVLVMTGIIAWNALRNREGSKQTAMNDQQSRGVAQPTIDPQRPPASGRDANNNRPEDKNSSKKPPPGHTNQQVESQKVSATFLITRPRVREEQNSPTLEISVQSGDIQLELELLDDNCAVYTAKLFAESGEELQRWESLRPRRDHSIPRVALRAPASSLKNAGYVIKLDCVSDSAPPEQYRFKVEKKA